MLADLRMPGSLEAVDAILSDIDGGRLAATEAISRLLSAQISLRNNRRLAAAMRSSRLPAVKTLESFDFSFQPSIKREQIESLHELGFVDRKENVVLLGPPGVGKTRDQSGHRRCATGTTGLLRYLDRPDHLAGRSAGGWASLTTSVGSDSPLASCGR
jgi:hypothetical protein